ncbi:MAG: translational machinery protein [Alphaproteobacteria bacterium]|nr:translational machinery protein [Alphaproteobacteria bacterium]
MHFHAVVWLDHRAARIFGFDLRGSDHTGRQIVSHAPHHLHHKTGSASGEHVRGNATYFDAIAAGLTDFQEILIAGPAAARTEFAAHVHSQHPALAARLVGNLPMDHASDGEIIAAARAFFQQADRMTPQR